MKRRYLRRVANLVALLCAVMSTLPVLENRPPRGVYLWLPKLFACALAPFIGLLGLVSAGIGLFARGWLAMACGAYSALSAWRYMDVTVRQPQQTMQQRFRRAFGPRWEARLVARSSPQQRAAMRQKRWQWLAAKDPPVRWLRDLAFWRDSQSKRPLLCDIWLPPEAVPQSGLGILYFHGSAWCLGDKDLGTRPFFRHLAIAAQVPAALGGSPDEIPEVYARYSPLTYAGPAVPQTFLVQGADDIGAPLEAACELSARLYRGAVPVINLVLPHAEHGFDLVLPGLSRAAQSAQYELDRFLALI